MGRLKQAWTIIQFEPVWRSVTEALCILIFTFGPFGLLAIKWKAADEPPSFWSFWTSGEIALPVLSLCGGIVALAATRHRALHKGLVGAATIIALICAGSASYAVAISDGFSEPLAADIMTAGFLAYGMLLFFWVAMHFYSNEFPDRPDPEGRAQQLLASKNGPQEDAQ